MKWLVWCCFLSMMVVVYANRLESGVVYADEDGTDDKKLVCYYGSWAVYRPGNGKFPVEEIDPFLCTHIIYGFTGLSHDNKIRPLDPYNDLKENWGKGAFLRFTGLKKMNPKLKTLVAIGGWNEGSVKYSNMAANPQARKEFVASVVEFLQKYDFDGLDFDWEYPSSRGGMPQDKQNFVAILKELKEAFRPHGYLLTAAVSAGKATIDPGYDIPKMSEHLDIINVMCYDYHGGWESKTGHNAPLYARPDESVQERQLNVNFSINYWISHGAPRSKIVLGMGSYGRSFTLTRPENNGFNADAPQKGRAGPYTREPGSLGYNELCEMKQRDKSIVDVWDSHHLAPYAHWERQWVGYDDIESISLKTKYAKAMGLGGAMVWSIETDDFKGICGDGKYPLLNAIKRILNQDGKPSLPMPNEREETTTTKSPPSSSPRPSEPTTPSSTRQPTASTTTMRTTTQRSSSTMSSSSTTVRPSPTSASSSTYTTSKWWPYPPSTWWPRPSSTASPGSSVWWGQAQSADVTTPTPKKNKAPETAINSIETEDIALTKSTSLAPTTSSTDVKEQENDKPASFTCRESGLYRSPSSCLSFVRCLATQVEGVFQVFQHDCPERTVFNNITKLCDWVENVPECLKHVPKDYLRGIQLSGL